jgi:hypothetical protein
MSFSAAMMIISSGFILLPAISELSNANWVREMTRGLLGDRLW